MLYCRSFRLDSKISTVLLTNCNLRFLKTVLYVRRPLQRMSVLDARWDRTAHRYKLPDRNKLCLLYYQVCQVEHWKTAHKRECPVLKQLRDWREMDWSTYDHDRLLL